MSQTRGGNSLKLLPKKREEEKVEEEEEKSVLWREKHQAVRATKETLPCKSGEYGGKYAS